MDSEHRHELKENDLAEFIANFGQWWSAHGKTFLTVLLVVVGSFTGWRWIQNQAAQAKEKAWTDLAFATSPESYQYVAQSHKDPAVRALAYLRAADLSLAIAMVPAGTDPNDDDNSADTPTVTPDQALRDAGDMYQLAIDEPGTHPIYKLNAYLGLAAVAEGQHEWDTARGHYQTAFDQAQPGYTAIATRAKAGLDTLDRLMKPVVFGPEALATQPSETESAPTQEDTTPAAQPDNAGDADAHVP